MSRIPLQDMPPHAFLSVGSAMSNNERTCNKTQDPVPLGVPSSTAATKNKNSKATENNKNTNNKNDSKNDNDQLGAHGSKLKHKRRYCRIEGCEKIVKSQGLCQRHGAKPRLCKIEGCTKQAQGNFDGMCKSHFKAHKRLTNPIPKPVQRLVAEPPQPEGPSVYDQVLPASVDFFPLFAAPEPKNGDSNVLVRPRMPLVQHLKDGFDGGKPPAWHRNEERKARGLMPIRNPATQLEGWERELVWMEILILTGVPEVSFRHLARAWGRDKGFHMVLAQFICERHGDVERKKRKRGELAAVAAAAAIVMPNAVTSAGVAPMLTIEENVKAAALPPGTLQEAIVAARTQNALHLTRTSANSARLDQSGSNQPPSGGGDGDDEDDDSEEAAGGDAWDESYYGDSNYNEALAADLFNLNEEDTMALMKRLSSGRRSASAAPKDDDESQSCDTYSRPAKRQTGAFPFTESAHQLQQQPQQVVAHNNVAPSVSSSVTGEQQQQSVSAVPAAVGDNTASEIPAMVAVQQPPPDEPGRLMLDASFTTMQANSDNSGSYQLQPQAPASAFPQTQAQHGHQPHFSQDFSSPTQVQQMAQHSHQHEHLAQNSSQLFGQPPQGHAGQPHQPYHQQQQMHHHDHNLHQQPQMQPQIYSSGQPNQGDPSSVQQHQMGQPQVMNQPNQAIGQSHQVIQPPPQQQPPQQQQWSQGVPHQNAQVSPLTSPNIEPQQALGQQPQQYGQQPMHGATLGLQQQHPPQQWSHQNGGQQSQPSDMQSSIQMPQQGRQQHYYPHHNGQRQGQPAHQNQHIQAYSQQAVAGPPFQQQVPQQQSGGNDVQQQSGSSQGQFNQSGFQSQPSVPNTTSDSQPGGHSPHGGSMPPSPAYESHQHPSAPNLLQQQQLQHQEGNLSSYDANMAQMGQSASGRNLQEQHHNQWQQGQQGHQQPSHQQPEQLQYIQQANHDSSQQQQFLQQSGSLQAIQHPGSQQFQQTQPNNYHPSQAQQQHPSSQQFQQTQTHYQPSQTQQQQYVDQNQQPPPQPPQQQSFGQQQHSGQQLLPREQSTGSHDQLQGSHASQPSHSYPDARTPGVARQSDPINVENYVQPEHPAQPLVLPSQPILGQPYIQPRPIGRQRTPPSHHRSRSYDFHNLHRQQQQQQQQQEQEQQRSRRARHHRAKSYDLRNLNLEPKPLEFRHHRSNSFDQLNVQQLQQIHEDQPLQSQHNGPTHFLGTGHHSELNLHHEQYGHVNSLESAQNLLHQLSAQVNQGLSHHSGQAASHQQFGQEGARQQSDQNVRHHQYNQDGQGSSQHGAPQQHTHTQAGDQPGLDIGMIDEGGEALFELPFTSASAANMNTEGQQQLNQMHNGQGQNAPSGQPKYEQGHEPILYHQEGGGSNNAFHPNQDGLSDQHHIHLAQDNGEQDETSHPSPHQEQQQPPE